MISYIMRSLLLIFLCALHINSHARTLTEKSNRLDETNRKSPSRATGVADYSRPATPPSRNPPLIEMITHQVTSSGAVVLGEYGKQGGGSLPPPTPHHAPPTHQVTGEGAAALGNYGKEGRELPPPTPHHAPPTHQVSGGGAVALGNYGKEGGKLPPPTPHHAPPTHQVTGGGAAALGNYGKEGGELPPPTPHHAPPTHQVSGGGVAEEEQSWSYDVFLSASALS